MAASYPSSVKTYIDKNPGETILDTHVDDLQVEITAIEDALVTTGIAHNLFPSATRTRDLGTTSLLWRDLQLGRTAVITQGAITASTPAWDMTSTWNSGATTFTGLKYNVTDTASAAASLLFDLQVGGASKFKVDKSGAVTASSFSSGVTGSADFAATWTDAGTTYTGLRLTVTDTASAAGSKLMDLIIGGISRFNIVKDGALALTTGTFTSDKKVMDLTTTWNSGGTTFTGMRLNVTDSASAAASLLIDMLVGGTSKFKVTKGGVLTVNGIRTKGEPVYNVKEYGATGDGATNDTTAVTSALTDVPSTGGVVYFPPGTYMLNDIEITKDYVTFEGAGYSSLLKSISANKEIFRVGTSSTGPNHYQGITFTRLRFQQPIAGLSGDDGHCIMVHGGYGIKVINCDFITVKGGVKLGFNGEADGTRESRDCVVANNRFYDVYKIGIELPRTLTSVVIGNVIRSETSGAGTLHGIRCLRVTNIVVANNAVYGMDNGIWLQTGDTPFSEPRFRQAVVVGNMIVNAGTYGIHIRGTVFNILVANNLIMGGTSTATGTATSAGIHLLSIDEGGGTYNTPQDVVISGNLIRANTNMQRGIHCVGVTGGPVKNVRITDNVLYDIGLNGLFSSHHAVLLDKCDGFNVIARNISYSTDTKHEGFNASNPVAGSANVFLGNVFVGPSPEPKSHMGKAVAENYKYDASGWDNNTYIDTATGEPISHKSPTQLTVDQTDYYPSEFSVWRLTSNASRSIHSIDGARPGKRLTIINVGSSSVVLKHNSGTGTASMKILSGTGADVSLGPDDSAELFYDGESNIWRIVNDTV